VTFLEARLGEILPDGVVADDVDPAAHLHDLLERVCGRLGSQADRGERRQSSEFQ